MTGVTVFLSKALLCVSAQCWPVLVGVDTPTGTFTLQQRFTVDAGYGGDVLQFHETNDTVYAVHRVWTLRPQERREQRLRDPDPARRVITKGCVNVDPVLYDWLAAHHRGATMVIVK